jgi:hypothetical protein
MVLSFLHDESGLFDTLPPHLRSERETPLDAHRVTLDARLLSAVEKYADLTGNTTESCIEEAVTDWLTTTAFARIEARSTPQLAAAS